MGVIATAPVVFDEIDVVIQIHSNNYNEVLLNAECVFCFEIDINLYVYALSSSFNQVRKSKSELFIVKASIYCRASCS